MEQKKFEYNETNYDDNMGMNMNMGMNNMNCCMMNPCQNMMCPPIQECPQERVCHRYICYEVPQD